MDQITQLIVLIFVGIIGGMIAKKLKQPIIVGYILASTLFTTFFPLVQDNESIIYKLSEIGVTLLLFSIGIDFSLDKLLAVKKHAIVGGVLQIVFTVLLGILIFPLLEFSPYESLFLGAVFSMSSTAVVVRILEELDIIDHYSSEITLGWLVLQDIAVVFIIIMLGNLAQSTVDPSGIILSLIKSFVLIATSLVIGRQVLPRVLSSVSSLGSKELVVISAFGFSLLFALLAEKLGVSSTLGAFLAGLMIADSILNHEILTEIKPLQAIFSMLFFVTIGSLFSLKFVLASLVIILLILIITLFIKIVLVLALCLFLKLHIKTSLEIALYLAQIGEFAFLSSQIAFSKGWISHDFNSLVIAVTVLSLIITPVFIINTEKIYKYLGSLTLKLSPAIYRRLFTKLGEDDLYEAPELKNHIVILGYGRVGKYLALALRRLRQEFLVVEMNNASDLAEIEKEIGTDRLLVGDATNFEILKAANLEKAKIVIITLPKDTDVGEVIRIAKGMNPDIQLIIRKHHDSLVFNDEDVFAVIEPEFEATLKMLEKLMQVLRKKDKQIIEWVKLQKKGLH